MKKDSKVESEPRKAPKRSADELAACQRETNAATEVMR